MEVKTNAGRPRSDSSRSALINATFDLLREVGYERMSIDAIASKAGVGKTTIYRWYGTKDELVIEALTSVSQQDSLFIPDTGSLASDLEAIIQHRLENDPLCFNRSSCALTVSALAGSSELAQTYWNLYITKKRSAYTVLFDRAKERGELAKNADTEMFLDLLHGYVLFGLLVRPNGRITAQAVGDAVRCLLLGYKPKEKKR